MGPIFQDRRREFNFMRMLPMLIVLDWDCFYSIVTRRKKNGSLHAHGHSRLALAIHCCYWQVTRGSSVWWTVLICHWFM